MELWRKIAVVIVFLGFLLGVVSEGILVVIDVETSVFDFIIYYTVWSMMMIFFYNGQFDGHEYVKYKFSKVLSVFCFPGLFAWGLIAYVIGFIISIREDKKKRR